LHLPPVSLTPVANLELRISPRIFEKIRNYPNGMLRGLGETDSWKKLEVENLVTLSLLKGWRGRQEQMYVCYNQCCGSGSKTFGRIRSGIEINVSDLNPDPNPKLLFRIRNTGYYRSTSRVRNQNGFAVCNWNQPKLVVNWLLILCSV
jgi:hypothetical protein